MSIDLLTGFKLETQVLKEVEEKLKRKLSEEERSIARLAARRGIFKGIQFKGE